jgi:hypothetical protein
VISNKKVSVPNVSLLKFLNVSVVIPTGSLTYAQKRISYSPGGISVIPGSPDSVANSSIKTSPDVELQIPVISSCGKASGISGIRLSYPEISLSISEKYQIRPEAEIPTAP